MATATKTRSKTPNKIPHGKKRAFLASYGELGNITLAAEAAKIYRTTHYDWLESDPDYRQRYEDAREAAADRLEAEARRRAVEGVRKPAGWFRGEPGGYVQEYSDTLLIFLLKGLRPEKYVEYHKHEITDKSFVVFASPPVTKDEWRDRYAPSTN